MAQALSVWSHPLVPVELLRVEVDGLNVRLELALHYRCDVGRVCCGEPACYVGFLGANRDQVPRLLEAALGLPLPPHVSMTVHLRHEPGYAYASVSTGMTARDQTLVYDASHFAAEDHSPV